MQEIMELKRQGLGVRAISRLTGYDRKTVSKYLAASGEAPAMVAQRRGFDPRQARPAVTARGGQGAPALLRAPASCHHVLGWPARCCSHF